MGLQETSSERSEVSICGGEAANLTGAQNGAPRDGVRGSALVLSRQPVVGSPGGHVTLGDMLSVRRFPETERLRLSEQDSVTRRGPLVLTGI